MPPGDVSKAPFEVPSGRYVTPMGVMRWRCQHWGNYQVIDLQTVTSGWMAPSPGHNIPSSMAVSPNGTVRRRVQSVYRIGSLSWTVDLFICIPNTRYSFSRSPMYLTRPVQQLDLWLKLDRKMTGLVRIHWAYG